MNKSIDDSNVKIEIKIWQTVDGLKIVEFMRTEGPAHDYYTYVREFREEYFENTSDIQVAKETPAHLTQMAKKNSMFIQEKMQAKSQQMNEPQMLAKQPHIQKESLTELGNVESQLNDGY